MRCIPPSLRRPISRLLSSKKTYASTSIWSLEEVKAAGRPFGATLNDVVMAVLSAAIRKYLIHTQCPVVEANKDLEIRNLSILNTRALSDMDGILAEFEKGETSNEFSYVVSRMFVGDMSMVERLKKCSMQMDELKRSPEAYIMRDSNDCLKKMFGGKFVVDFTSDKVINKFHNSFSNVPGPQKKLRLCGEEMEMMANFVHPMFYGYALSTQSYNGKIVTNVACDSEIMTEPDLFVKYADEAFLEMCEAAEKERKRVAVANANEVQSDLISDNNL